MEQLPNAVADSIYTDFLFGNFLTVFKNFFHVPYNLVPYPQNVNENRRTTVKLGNYSWEDGIYREFMLMLLSNLEPRRENSQAILFTQLDEVDEVIFCE